VQISAVPGITVFLPGIIIADWSLNRPFVDGFQALAQKWEEYEKKDLNPGLHRCQCGIFSQINILSKAVSIALILSCLGFFNPEEFCFCGS
jgi:hypothetical protein